MPAMGSARDKGVQVLGPRRFYEEDEMSQTKIIDYDWAVKRKRERGLERKGRSKKEWWAYCMLKSGRPRKHCKWGRKRKGE